MSLRIYGNRLLKTLPGQATRPTPGRVREALFNIWQGSVESCRWLDLCSGSGAMGAEALARGAALVVGIEQSGRACAVIQENWQKVAHPDQSFKLLRGDILQQLPRLAGQQFDHIYFDPPYASDLYLPVLQHIHQYHLLSPDGELAVEHDPTRWPAPVLTEFLNQVIPLALRRQKSYGNTGLLFFQREEHPL
jgi:16S rRNA (guanine966-N2)-methyltransferase